MKTIALIRRRPNLSREAFRDYYESKHAPMAVRYVHFTKYVRNHLIAPSDPPYDVLSEFWLADPSVVTSLATSPAGEMLRRDAARFVTETRLRAAVEESLLAGPPRGIEIGRVKKYAVMLTRRAYATAADFIADTIDWGQRLGAVPAVTRVTFDLVTPIPGNDFPADAILSLWPTELFDPGILDALPRTVEAAAVLTLDAYETPPATLKAVH